MDGCKSSGGGIRKGETRKQKKIIEVGGKKDGEKKEDLRMNETDGGKIKC